jgi:predicted MFS family arabinose efflux permease
VAPSRGRELVGLLLLALAITYASATRALFSPLQELAKADLGLSDLDLSLVQGLAASLPIALLSIPVGRMVDRANRLRILLALTAVSATGTVATAWAEGLATLFIARMLAGVGAALAVPVAISIAADLSRPQARGRALLYLSVGNMLGAAAAFALAGWLLAALPSWRRVHLAFAAFGIAVILALVCLREPARRETGATLDAPFRAALRALWARRALLAPLFVGQVTVVMADMAAVTWAAPVLTRSYQQRPADFAGWMGLVLLVSGLVGSTLGGFAADRGYRSANRAGIVRAAVAAAAISVPAAFYPVMPTVPAFAVALAVFLICGAITGLVTATALAVLVPNELRGVCLGAFMVVGGMIGFGVAPTLVTVASQALGGDAHLGEALAAVGAGTSLLALAGFLRAAAVLRRDRASEA